MQDRKLYEQLLGIHRPWRVRDIDLQLEDGDVVVFVEHMYDFGALGALQNIAHSASTLVIYIEARTNQGFANEAYAIDNLRISLVPEPTTTALLAFGLLGAGFARKRRAH